MLRDVINFVKSRLSFDDDRALREINIAYKELWATNDFENSVQEISVMPVDQSNIITLPWYVDVLKAVKLNPSRERVRLFDPRPYYQDETYWQSPFAWRVLGTSPLNTSITNATTLTLTIPKAETARFIVTLQGPSDYSQNTREQVVFEIGDTEHETERAFLDVTSLSKDVLTNNDVKITTASTLDIASIPNHRYEARNTVVQITDKLYKPCNFCQCWDILYKNPCPILVYPETPVPGEESLMNKVMEWVTMPQEDGGAQAALFNLKSEALLKIANNNVKGVDKPLDMQRSPWETRYYGNL